METRGRRVYSVEKAIRLLDCFWQERRPLSLRELEQRTGWAKSTIHGLLASMLDSAVVEQNSSDGKYRLGYHLFELGSAVSRSWDLPRCCAPYLQELVDRFGESAYLARLSGNELLLALCEEPHGGFRIVSEEGTRLPLHCSCQGKAILAQKSLHEAKRLLQRKELTRYTPHTITREEILLQQLEDIRSQGVAYEIEEYKLGLKSVAAPIIDRSGQCDHAIAIICMATVEQETFDAMAKAVKEAAGAISQQLREK
ncbi:MAG: IclR family transcriptional regulator [Oscillospiraceae bacterium]|nr:IclR family transcriptional regulator [Oscillospiraceae bacterium]